MEMKTNVFAIVGYRKNKGSKFPIEAKKNVKVKVDVSNTGKVRNLRQMWLDAASAFRSKGLSNWKTLSYSPDRIKKELDKKSKKQ